MAGSARTRNALEIAKKYGAKFLHASTSECYGDPSVHPQTEDYWGNVNPIGIRSLYDEAKCFSEALVMVYHRYQRVDTRLVRIFNAYGRRLQKDDGRVIANFMVQALKGENLTVYGEGMQTRSFSYGTDEIAGILGLSLTILECAKAVLRVTGSKSEITYRPLPQDDPAQRQPDIRKAKRLFGLEPKIDLEAGLKLSLEYFISCAKTLAPACSS